MEITPAEITAATFKTSRKGFDPSEVRDYLGRVAKALEDCRQHATAMEARARAAVSRLQEYQAGGESGPPSAAPTAADPQAEMRVAPDAAETISRTLVLAQRTADTALAEARAEAERIRAEARSEAEATLDSTRELTAKLIEDARVEARQASEDERQTAENEVEALKARREFLLGDVDQLEAFLIDQRERLRGAARQIESLCERVPSGLGELRPPVMSASDDSASDASADATGQVFRTAGADAPFADAPSAPPSHVDEPTQPLAMLVADDEPATVDAGAEAPPESAPGGSTS